MANPPFIPTPEQKELVKNLLERGFRKEVIQQKIASTVTEGSISSQCFYEAFDHEIKTARYELLEDLSKTMVNRARDGDMQAIRYFLGRFGKEYLEPKFALDKTKPIHDQMDDILQAASFGSISAEEAEKHVNSLAKRLEAEKYPELQKQMKELKAQLGSMK